uniref:Integrase catalytic domain-containing protein n=1 Tax=Tanacetum cinerariifolium TaxID=118510 RepID=A0A6L2MMV2_TANCI|nr:hypothetical protein [Tanacetum cinerariifolium]
MPEASPKDIYDYYVHGLLDTIYINGETLKELQEFPLKVQGIIKGYKEVFAKGRELFLKIRSSYPIFDKEQKLLVPSITVAQLGVSNKGYPEKDEKIECAPPMIKDLVYSFMEVLAGSSKIGIGPRQKDKIKINYCSKSLFIYSKSQERIDEVQLKVLSDFEYQIELFSGLQAPLPKDLKQQLCSYMTRNIRHHCYCCSEGTSSSPIMEDPLSKGLPQVVSEPFGKGKIKTGKLDFDDVYFVKELKFNLFSVSQMCDKKNSVLFTDTECLVLSSDFKLPNASGDLTCLFTKATLDESNLWHRRLGHVNFKTINKLVKGNPVRGLPTKVFTNENSCVACKKGKQHRASCKSKTVSYVDQPLFWLHMDLFRPTFVKSLSKKSYCLVITDDYSRFFWVFFLASKDETPPVLKTFIIGGIKRKFSVPRTPQHNGIAERKNRTLIEAARTLVLVTKPHNKTPYELLHGRLPSIGFMRPFGCPVTILNTLDPLGKFQGKVDEGFLVGYSVCSKAFRVFNSRTRVVQETLHNNNKDALVDGKEHDDDIQNAASPSNAAASPTAANSSDMPNFEDLTHSNDADDVGAEADINNLESIISVSPILTTRIHKDHLTSQIIGDLSSTTQTRRVNTPRSDEDRLKLMELMVLLLQKGKSDAAEGFEQIIDFLSGSYIHYALTVNPHIYISCIKQFRNTASVKRSDDVTRLQALVDKKKIVISEVVIREILQLDDAEGVVCLPNEEIFACLAQMGYEKPSTKLTFYKAFFSSQWKFLIHTILLSLSAKRTSWNEFSTAMASAVSCLSKGQKFNFSKYIFDSLVRNVDSSSKFYMYPRFIQLIIQNQIGDLSTHSTRFISLALTQKVFANMRRVGKVNDAVAAAVQENVAEDVAHDVIPSPPSHDIPSPSQEPSLPQQPQSSPQTPPQGAYFPTHIQQVLDVCSALTRRVENLEHDNAAQKLEIIKLQARVKRLERANKVKSSKLRRLRKVGPSRRVESSDDIEDVFNQGRMIDDMDKDKGIELAEIYNLDLDHSSKVLSMQEDDSEVQEVVEILNISKLITDVVTAASQVSAASATISAAAPTVVVAYTRRRKGVIIRDPEEELSSKTPAETPKVKDKGKGILVETPKPIKKKDQIELDAEYARKLHEEINRDHEEIKKDIDWDVANDHVNQKSKNPQYIKRYQGMKKRPQTETSFDENMRFLFKSREEMEEEDQEIIKSINETPAQKAAKRRKLSEEAQEAEDFRKRLEVVDDEDDDVFIEATPLARKLFLLVERRYPLSRFTLEQLVNVTRLQVEEESEMSLELLRGIYTDWATASTHIIGKSVSYKSYLAKEAAEKALEESYKTIATEETQKSKQFVSLNQHLQSQAAKLNAFNRMKNIPIAKEKEEMRRPTVENFQRLLDILMNYNEVHATMLFYPQKKRNIGPKAVFMLEASPKDIYDYYVHGLVDTIYINGETLKELQEFPLKVQGIIKGYKEVFAKVRELFLKIRSSYPIFDKEQKLLVPSITVAQLGVSNKGYPEKDGKIECAPPTIEDLERIDEVQLKVLSDFEDQIELFLGLLALFPEDLKQQLCSYMTRNTRHHCYYCSEGSSSSPIMEG